MLERYLKNIHRNRKFILLLFVGLTTWGFHNAYHMYANMVTNLDELLPRSIKSIVDLKHVSKKLQSMAHLAIVLESDDGDAMKQFSEDIHASLIQKDSEYVGDILYKLSDQEQQYLKQHVLLYLDISQLEELERFVKKKIAKEKKKSKIFLSLGDPEEDLDAEYDLSWFKERESQLFLDKAGYSMSPDNKNLVMLIYLPGLATNIENALRLKEVVADSVDQFRSRYPMVNVGYTDDVQSLIDEHFSVMEDLIKSSVIVMLMVMLVMVLYFLNFKALWLITVSLLSGTCIAFGLSYYFVDYLNANTAFLGAIVFGNGINFSIIMMARFLEELGKNKNIEASLDVGIRRSIKATLTASLAAACAYGALIVTDFRGFNQFGIIGFIGMVMNWVATYTLLPALCLTFPIKGFSPPKRKILRGLASTIQKYALPISGVSICLVILSIWSLKRFNMDFIETNFSNLRSKTSLVSGSGFWGSRVDAVFRRSITPAVVFTHSKEESQRVSRSIEEYLEHIPKNEQSISHVQTLNDFIPVDQETKLSVIQRMQSYLTPSVRKHLPRTYQDLVNSTIPDGPISQVVLADLPQRLLRSFKLSDGTLSHMVLAYPSLSSATDWEGKDVIRFVDQLRKSVAQTGKNYPIAGQFMISSDIIDSIFQDGPKATAVAFSIVVLLVLLLLRNVQIIFSVLTSLVLGVLFLLACMSVFTIKINFLNFIALPITFGIGVDYAVNLFHRVKIEGWKHLPESIANTGGALILCSLTTIIGYSSLLIADNQGFVSFGLLAVLGEITCLVAAIVIMPAFYFSFKKKLF